MKTETLVAQLKQELKNRGLTYAELARKIGLSEAAVKRLFAEKNFSLQRLDEICEAAGIDLLQLTLTASRNMESHEPLSDEVELALSQDSDLLLVLYLALQGLSMQAIQNEIKYDERKVFRICRELESLKLLEIHPGNMIRCKVSKSTRWNPVGPLVRKYGLAIREEFFSSEFTRPSEFQDFLTGPLSMESFRFFQKKLAALFREFSELSRIDSKCGGIDSEVFWFYAGIRPWSPIGVIKRVEN